MREMKRFFDQAEYVVFRLCVLLGGVVVLVLVLQELAQKLSLWSGH